MGTDIQGENTGRSLIRLQDRAAHMDGCQTQCWAPNISDFTGGILFSLEDLRKYLLHLENVTFHP